MKTAIYVEDGVTQLVITPESKFEKEALAAIQNNTLETKIFSGTFYNCNGGWVRHKEIYQHSLYNEEDNEQSLILKIITEKGEE